MTILDQALELAARGLYIFVVDGKIPYKGFAWPELATTDATIIRNWFDQWPKSNYAIACGPSKLLVLDVDGNKGRESLQKLQERMKLGKPTVVTGTGGLHYYFRCSDPNTRNSVGLLDAGLDIRTNGGYVVGPGSIHPDTGKEYTWFGGSRPQSLHRVPPELLVRIYTRNTRESRATEGPIPESYRNAHLASLAGSMRRKGASESVLSAALQTANREQCAPPLSEAEVERIAHSIARYKPEEINIERIVSTYTRGSRNKPQARIAAVTRAIDVEEKEVNWFWKPWIPEGKVTLVEGDPGTCKTYIVLTLAARLSRGLPFPGETEAREPGATVYLTAEDGIDDTIVPRFTRAGGDKAKLFCVEGIQTGDARFPIAPISMADLDALDGVLAEIKPKLLVLDPVQGFLGAKVDMNQSNQVRPLMKGISDLVERHGCSCLILRHLRKPSNGGDKKGLYRGLGSIDFTAFARSVLQTTADEEDSTPGTHGVLTQIKSSLDVKAPSLRYTVAGKGVLSFETPEKFIADNLIGNFEFS